MRKFLKILKYLTTEIADIIFWLNTPDKNFKKDGIFQSSSPIFSIKFSYGLIGNSDPIIGDISSPYSK